MQELILHDFYIADVRVNNERVVCIINHKPGFCSIWFLDMLLFDVVNLDFITAAVLGVISSQPSGLFKSTVRKFITIRLDNNMGTWSTFCVKPPVTAICKRESQFIVLDIIFTNVNVISVTFLRT